MTGCNTPTTAHLIVAVLVVLFALTSLVGGAAAQTDTATPTNSTLPDYYDTASNDTGQDTWMEGRENPTLGNVTSYVASIQAFVIGGGMSAQGGIGSAGALLSGGLVILLALGVGAGTQVGAPGGAALGVALLSVLSGLGLLPSWLYAVFLLLLSLVLVAAYLRSQR